MISGKATGYSSVGRKHGQDHRWIYSKNCAV